MDNRKQIIWWVVIALVVIVVVVLGDSLAADSPHEFRQEVRASISGPTDEPRQRPPFRSRPPAFQTRSAADAP